MDSAFWPAVGIPLAVGALLSLAAEVLLLPRPRPAWRRAAGTNAIHAGLWLVLCACLLVVWRRPVFAVFNALALELLIVLVSRAKYLALREPFLVQDFDYFVDALRHPRLYVPFLGIAGCAIAALAYAAAVWAGVALEPSLLGTVSPADFGAGIGALAAVGFALLALGSRGAAPPTWDPSRDLERLGLAAHLWLYAMALRRSRNDRPTAAPFDLSPARGTAPQPAVVVVQSESFFDPRSLHPGIRPAVLREFDALRAGAASHGTLEVPAWGANTVRTEFAFLSGLGAEALGVHRFNPYRRIARRGVPTIASFFRSRGYRTVCVHPYPAAFYARDAVYPRLGFDAFIDIEAFADAAKQGPYIGDAAVAEKVCALLGEPGAPLFVFVITMENHGPLHLETVQDSDAERFYAQPPSAGSAELTVYLRHLAHADRMAGRLRERLESLPVPGWLCWYGDHVPIMPAAYAALGAPAGRTDYVIWRTGGVRGEARHLKVEDLGVELLRAMGLIGSAARPPARDLPRDAGESDRRIA